MDGGLRAAEFNDLLEICAFNLSRGRWRAIEADLEGNQAVTSAVGDPKCLDSRIIIDVSEHFEIFLWAIDKLDRRKYVFGHDRQKLENCTVLPANNDTIVDESDGRRDVITADFVRPKRRLVWNVPKCQCRIFRDRGKSIVEDVEVESDEVL